MRHEQRRFDRATIEFIRTTPTASRLLAEAYGVSRTMINNIRAGRYYADCLECPPINAGPGVSCQRCIHWSESSACCTLGLPDPLTEGVAFARDCSAFQRIPR